VFGASSVVMEDLRTGMLGTRMLAPELERLRDVEGCCHVLVELYMNGEGSSSSSSSDESSMCCFCCLSLERDSTSSKMS
jgi:hypothetical protein